MQAHAHKLVAVVWLGVVTLPSWAQSPMAEPAMPGDWPLLVEYQARDAEAMERVPASQPRCGDWQPEAVATPTTSNWQTEQAWQLPLPAPICVFGKLGAQYEEWGKSMWNVSGRSGVAWKLHDSSLGDVQVRAGPVLSRSGLQVFQAQEAELLLELQCRCPLPGPLQLQYLGSALTSSANEHLQHDLGFSMPFLSSGQFRFGARHQAQDAAAPRPWVDDLHVYLGFDMKR